MWNESIVKVSEENKKPWFTWLNESLTRVYLSGEEQEKWLKDAMNANNNNIEIQAIEGKPKK